MFMDFFKCNRASDIAEEDWKVVDSMMNCIPKNIEVSNITPMYSDKLINEYVSVLKIKLEYLCKIINKVSDGRRYKLEFVSGLFSDNEDSKLYVSMKNKFIEKHFSEYINITNIHETGCDAETVMNICDETIKNKNVDGFLIQLPIPIEGLNQQQVISLFDKYEYGYQKDLDCLSYKNTGKLYDANSVYSSSFNFNFVSPCTAKGIIELLKYYNISFEGKTVLIMGRSNIVGRPLVELFNKNNATVIMANRRTPIQKLKSLIDGCDILVSATGVRDIISSRIVDRNKKFLALVDVGAIVEEENGKRKVYGDIEDSILMCQSAFYTPHVRSVGPMTILCMISNMIELSESKYLDMLK